MILDLPLEQVKPDPNQPRKTFDKKTIAELAESIREQGLIQPITVTPTFVFACGHYQQPSNPEEHALWSFLIHRSWKSSVTQQALSMEKDQSTTSMEKTVIALDAPSRNQKIITAKPSFDLSTKSGNSEEYSPRNLTPNALLEKIMSGFNGCGSLPPPESCNTFLHVACRTCESSNSRQSRPSNSSKSASQKIEDLDGHPDKMPIYANTIGNKQMTKSVKLSVGQPHPLLIDDAPFGYQGKILAIYTIVAGERRYRAHLMAGLSSIKAIIKTDEIVGARRLTMQLIENLQREEMNPIETAKGLRDLVNAEWPVEKIGQRLGYAPETIEKKLSLNSLEAKLQTYVASGQIPESVALLLTKLSSEGQYLALRKVKNKPYSQAKPIIDAILEQEQQVDLFATPAPARQQKSLVKRYTMAMLATIAFVRAITGNDYRILANGLDDGRLGKRIAEIDLAIKGLRKIKGELDTYQQSKKLRRVA